MSRVARVAAMIRALAMVKYPLGSLHPRERTAVVWMAIANDLRCRQTWIISRTDRHIHHGDPNKANLLDDRLCRA